MNNYSEILSQVEQSAVHLKKLRPAGEVEVWDAPEAKAIADLIEHEARASGVDPAKVAALAGSIHEGRQQYVLLMKQADASLARAEKYLTALGNAVEEAKNATRAARNRRRMV